MTEPLNTPRQAVGNLAIALGMWIGSGFTSAVQVDCFIESVLILAHKAGLEKEEATQPFDVFHEKALNIWERIEDENNSS